MTRRRVADLLGVLAVLLVVAGVVALVAGVRSQQPAPPQPAAAAGGDGAGEAAPTGQDTGQDRDRRATGRQDKGGSGAGDGRERPTTAAQRAAARIAGAQLTYSRPVRVEVPAIGVRSTLVELGLDAAGAMETPVPVDRAGWFRPSPPPGIPGATVLAGHVTWNRAPSVFFKLGQLRRGDQVSVRRADGAVAVFEVFRLGTFPKDGFPTRAVYDQPDRSELRLITCGGRYDESAHRYLSNLVVWAKLVDVRRS